MILNRLYELAVREKLLTEPAFEEMPVPYIVIVGEKGKFINIEERRNEITTVKKTKKGEEIKKTKDKGISISIPRPHGNTASQGFARFFVDTLPRVLPVETEAKNREKEERSRKTFWEQINNAADATMEPALLAVKAFGENLAKVEIAEKVRQAVKEKEIGPGDRLTFAYYPDGGKTVLESPVVRKWYADYYKQFTSDKQETGPIGFCTITGTVGPLPTSHTIPLAGVPEIKNGKVSFDGKGVRIVSFNQPAFWHYGFDKSANAAIGFEAADGYARAFNWLRNKNEHHHIVSGTLFLFWTRTKASMDVMAIFDAQPDQIKQLFENVRKGRPESAIDDDNDFYLLTVTGNLARVIVRDYLESKLFQVRKSITNWFHDLSISDPAKEHHGSPNHAFKMKWLAEATASDEESVSPDIQRRLTNAAINNGPLPDTILMACIARLRKPERDKNKTQFVASRLGLIKLCLIRKGIHVTETLDTGEKHPAYVYGRLLAVCDEIQTAALGDVNASVVDRYYGRFSSAPFLLLRRLIDGALDHLKKIRGGDKDWLHNILEERLTNVLKLVPPTPLGGQISLVDQARFSIGFFHQKAKTQEEIAERVRIKAEKTKQI